MARRDQAHPDNVDGDWFCDTRCIECDVARHYAPSLIASVGGQSVIARQPASPDEEAALWRAAVACPTQSIGTRRGARPPAGAFPWPVEQAPDVWLCGWNSAASYGAHSYLVTRPIGNLLVDSPRFVRPLYERIDELGGIAHVLLTHQDDVADAERWADRYGARVWIHARERAAAPYATDLLFAAPEAAPERAEAVTSGVLAHWVPGHTRGSVAFEIHRADGGTALATGDTLHWNHRRREPDVFPNQTWHSWDELVTSIGRLASLDVELLLAGHGRWHRFEPAAYRASMQTLVATLAVTDRRSWSRRPGAAFA